MKRYKTIILTALILIILLGVGLLLPSLLQGPNTSIQQEITTQLKAAEDISVVEETTVIEETTESEELEDETTEAETTVAEAEDETVTSIEDETVAQETTTTVVPEPTTEATIVDEEPQDTVTWLDEQLAEYEGQVEEVDVEIGIAIIEKLDIDYLNSLAEDGLTEEERSAVKEHLTSRLTEGEYATALRLYREYVELLQ